MLVVIVEGVKLVKLRGVVACVYVTVKDFGAVAPEVSLKVTVQFHVLVCIPVSLKSTLIRRVIEASEVIVTAAFQLLSPLFQV